MSYPDRLFPQTITPGDDLIFSHRRPEIPGYTSGTQDQRDTDRYEAIFTDTSTGIEQTFDATLNAFRDGTSEILIYRFNIDTTDWPARPYGWRIRGIWRRDGETRTLVFVRGLISVLDDSTSAAQAHAFAMVAILRDVIRDKLSGTGDISSYSIGGRDISLEPIGSLKRELRRYENDLIRLRGGAKFGPKVGSANTAPEG